MLIVFVDSLQACDACTLKLHHHHHHHHNRTAEITGEEWRQWVFNKCMNYPYETVKRSIKFWDWMVNGTTHTCVTRSTACRLRGGAAGCGLVADLLLVEFHDFCLCLGQESS